MAETETTVKAGRGGVRRAFEAADAPSVAQTVLQNEIARLVRFVQWVADHSNDPVVVSEAKKHGAK